MTAKTDRLVTLFGGGGFLGRYAAQALLNGGARLRVAERDPTDAWFLRPLARLGMIQFVSADVTQPDQVRAAVAGAEAVVNLVGILKGDFDKVHVDGARNVAEAGAAAGARAVVQVSAIGADPESASDYGRSKGEGEAAVRSAFDQATILRPSILFGPEDNFVNRFAGMARWLPVLPVIRPDWRLQPAWVADVARAVARAAFDPDAHGGKIYELGGPQVITMRGIGDWICEATGRGHKPVVAIPDAVAKAMARLFGWAPGAPMTWDQWLMLQTDNVASGEGFEALGLRPSPLAAVAESWLPVYRRRGRWARPAPY